MPLAQQPTVVISTLNEETEMDPIHTVDSAQKMDIALEALIINKSGNLFILFSIKKGVQLTYT